MQLEGWGRTRFSCISWASLTTIPLRKKCSVLSFSPVSGTSLPSLLLFLWYLFKSLFPSLLFSFSFLPLPLQLSLDTPSHIYFPLAFFLLFSLYPSTSLLSHPCKFQSYAFLVLSHLCFLFLVSTHFIPWPHQSPFFFRINLFQSSIETHPKN